ncbi:MAG: hypothetical protein ABI042_11750 [Verrucomicrobiota bacterium]
MKLALNFLKIVFTFVVLVHCGIAALAASFTNATTMTIADAICSGASGKASLYPSPIIVSGLSGTVTKITVTLFGMTHAFQGDYEVMLVGPGGGSQNLEILSDAGTGGISWEAIQQRILGTTRP